MGKLSATNNRNWRFRGVVLVAGRVERLANNQKTDEPRVWLSATGRLSFLYSNSINLQRDFLRYGQG